MGHDHPYLKWLFPGKVYVERSVQEWFENFGSDDMMHGGCGGGMVV